MEMEMDFQSREEVEMEIEDVKDYILYLKERMEIERDCYKMEDLELKLVEYQEFLENLEILYENWEEWEYESNNPYLSRGLRMADFL